MSEKHCDGQKKVQGASGEEASTTGMEALALRLDMVEERRDSEEG